MSGLLVGKHVLVMGVANQRSIAWATARAVLAQGGRLSLTYQSNRIKPRLERLLADCEAEVTLIECDVASDDGVARAMRTLEKERAVLHGLVHSIAYAPAEDLQGSFVETTRDARRLMVQGGSIVTMTYAGSHRVIPNYNVMGPAKASLEASVRYLAADLGPAEIRVNAVSAGPIHTVAARSIKDFAGMLELLQTHTPLRRNVTAEEVADATVFLLSDLSRAITGEIVHVDAGAHAVT
jgi:enoyl-[acyl-carrier protein] reductase I